jgi:flagellar biosynthetic protein FliR
VSPLDALLVPGGADAVVLAGLRVGGLVLLTPTLAARQVPMPWKASLLVLLTAMVWPFAQASVPAGTVPALTPAAALGETMVGMVLALGAALIVAAAEVAGDVIAMQTGLSGASSLDPVSFTSTPTLATFLRLVVLALLLVFDLHLVLVDGLAASFAVIPVGAPLDLAAGARALAETGVLVFTMGMRMAGPVVAAVLVLNVALAVLAKAAPQLQVISVAYSLQIGLGLFVVGGMLPFVAASLSGWQGPYDQLVGRLLDVFAAGGA